MSDSYQIRRTPSRRRQWLVAGLLVVAMGGGLLVLLEYRSEAIFREAEALRGQVKELNSAILQLRNDNVSLRKEQVALAHLHQQKIAALEEQRVIMEGQGKRLAQQDRELALFRNILGGQDKKRRLVMRNLEFSPASETGGFHFQVALTRGTLRGDELSGTLTIRFLPQANAEHSWLDIGEWPFRFRYFQFIDGTFELSPKNLTGGKLQVRAELDSGTRSSVEVLYRLQDGNITQPEAVNEKETE